MLVSIVCIAPILVSYSEKPDIIGSIVSDFAKFLPALTALLVIFANAVTPITPKADKPFETDDTPLSKPDIPSIAEPAPLLIPLNASELPELFSV